MPTTTKISPPTKGLHNNRTNLNSTEKGNEDRFKESRASNEKRPEGPQAPATARTGKPQNRKPTQPVWQQASQPDRRRSTQKTPKHRLPRRGCYCRCQSQCSRRSHLRTTLPTRPGKQSQKNNKRGCYCRCQPPSSRRSHPKKHGQSEVMNKSHK